MSAGTDGVFLREVSVHPGLDKQPACALYRRECGFSGSAARLLALGREAATRTPAGVMARRRLAGLLSQMKLED